MRYYEQYNLKRDDATPSGLVWGLACTADSKQNGNGQHLSPDQKIIKISDGVPSPEFQEEVRARLEASCITHSRLRSEFARPKFADRQVMTEEQFYAWEPFAAPPPAALAMGDEYGQMLDEMKANIEKPLIINPDE